LCLKLRHTSGLWCFHCLLYCFALGSNVSTFMTIQWCKFGERWSMSCEIFVVVYQLMRHTSGRHFAVNPAPCARWLWSAFDWLPSLSTSFQSVTQLRWCLPVASYLWEALYISSCLIHHALRNMESAVTVWWHIICITHSYLHPVFSCV
jgi:hypothetical protein